MKQEDNPLAFNGYVPAKFDKSFVSVMLGVKLCTKLSEALNNQRVLIQAFDNSLSPFSDLWSPLAMASTPSSVT